MLHLIVEFCSIAVKTRTLNVVLESNNDNQQGWGYAIDKVEHLSYDALIPFFFEKCKEKEKMKKTIVIALALLVFCACDEAYGPYEHEFVVSNDCSNGSMDVWMTFDSDAVRCGANRDLYFGIEWTNLNTTLSDEEFFKRLANPIDLYLYSDGSKEAIKDSVWILETDSAKISNCEKLSYSNSALKGTFCLNKFDNSSEKDYVSYYNGDKSKNNLMHYVIYRKFDSYKALCAIESSQCTLLYSCLIHYGEYYYFSRIPTLDGVNRKNIWCGNND